ncbi:MAG: type II methionyl aminopeptidase [Candidatus Freyarchaeota archaeon]|nr:type II methionyl aminopeptidase [Candidatus Jordarchaeia archaeon]
MSLTTYLRGVCFLARFKEEIIVDAYKNAGAILERAIREGEKLVKPGLPVLDLCEAVESRILEEGAQLAFPCNVSINEVAAHYTSPPEDATLIPQHAIVKIDAGAHIKGYIVDKAVSVATTQELKGLVHAAERALERALEVVKPGVCVSLIGEVIESTIRSSGFRPIINLSGHQIKRYQLHVGKTIPNFNTKNLLDRVKPGEVYAIEPFATDGVGVVVATRDAYIYRVLKPALLPKQLAEQLKKHSSLPFAARWIKGIDRTRLEKLLNHLSKRGVLASYPVLTEKSGGIVAQFETTILVTEKSYIAF